MTTSVKIKRGSGNAHVLVEEVSMTSGGPTTQRSHTLADDTEKEIHLHDGVMLHVSEQPAPVEIEPAPAVVKEPADKTEPSNLATGQPFPDSIQAALGKPAGDAT